MADAKYVPYTVGTSGDLPYVRAWVRGMHGQSIDLVHGAVPWHAAPVLREVAAELLQVAETLDRDYPHPGTREHHQPGTVHDV